MYPPIVYELTIPRSHNTMRIIEIVSSIVGVLQRFARLQAALTFTHRPSRVRPIEHSLVRSVLSEVASRQGF